MDKILKCVEVPIVIAISLIQSTVPVVGHGLVNSRNISTPGHLDKVEARDGEIQLDKPNTSNLTSRNFTLPSKPNDNPFKSRFKKPGVVLTLSLRPKGQIRINEKVEAMAPSSTSVMTSRISDLTEASFKLPTNKTNDKKPYTILDRLRKLTNTKMRQSTGTDFGFKNVVGLGVDDSEDDKSTTELPETVKGQITRIGGHLSHNLEVKSKPTLTLVVQPTTPPISSSTTEFPNTSEKVQVGSPDLEEEIEQEETRYITADQIGGNRPTKEPFHFTSSTTTTEAVTTPNARRQIKRYRKPHSPHNHIYAPTQDPINIAHNEDDLSVQDVQDYRAAHLTFGSKVGSGSVQPPTTIRPTLQTPPTEKVEVVTRPSVYRGLPPRSRSPNPLINPKKTTVHPQSASSGVKNSHIKIKPSGDSTNDNLPFYKEPGGVFEHKYPDNDNEPNEVDNQFDNNDRAPAIKYAPKGPSIQPQHHQQQPHIGYNSVNSQLQGYQNPPQAPVQHHPQRQYTRGPTPSPQYVTVTQQPIYLAPVPVQQQQVIHQSPGPAYNNFQAPSPPHQNYYPQQQPQPQHQPYYPAPSPPQHSSVAPQYQFQNQPNYNHAPNVAPTPAYHVPPGYPQTPPQQQQHYAQPPANNQNQNRFLHLNHPQTTPDYASQNIYNPPPSRYDPASDYYYGDPRPPAPAAAAKPKSKPLPSAAPPRARPSRNRVQDEEDEEEEEQPKNYNAGNRRNSGKDRERDRDRDRDRDRGRGRDRENTNDKYDDDRGQDEEEDDERYKKPPKQSRKNSSRNNPSNYNPEYDDEPLPSLSRGSGNRERDPPRKQNQRPGYDDYDSDPNENVGEFVRPAELSQRAYHDQRPNKEFVSLDNNFGGNNGRQFIPSERDNNFRPSPVDNGPNFDHPNIEYPGRGGSSQPQQQPEERPQKRVGNYDNENRFDTRLPPLDPIYTRTLQQYDEENTAPRDQGGVRPIEPEEDYPPPPYEVNEEQPHRPVSQRNRPVNEDRRRPPPPQEEEEEEEEEPEQRGQSQRGRPPPPPNDEEEEDDRPGQGQRERERERPPAKGQSQNEEEEEEPEAEEEETQEKPGQQEEEEQKPQEEEEEEEEEEDNGKRRKSKRQPKEEKKPPPEKPKSEKSGDLDDDISAIEKEFGFTVPKLDLS